MVSIRPIWISVAILALFVTGCGEGSSDGGPATPADGGVDVAPADALSPDAPTPEDTADDTTSDLGTETAPDVNSDATPDIEEPAGPIMIQAEVTWSGWSAEVRPAPAVFALETSSGLFLQDGEGALSLVDPENFESPLEGEVGMLDAGADFGPSGSLLASEEGLMGFVEGQLAQSPLDEHITESVQVMAYDTATDQLWLSTGSSLLLHEGGALYDIEPDGLPTGPAHLAYGGAVDGVPSVWIASATSIYALSGAGDELSVSAWVEGITALDLECDADGRVWASADGDLYRRAVDGTWDWLRLPSPVSQLAAHPSSGALWISTSDGLWRHEAGQFGPVDDAASGSWLTMNEAGEIIGSDTESVWRMGVGEEPLPPPPPTWTEDIEPISEASCILCHGPGALGADQMYLAAQWEERIDDILLVVSSGAMPLPPNPALDPAMIARIEGWKAAGFPE